MSYANSAGKYTLYLKPDENYKMKITTKDKFEIIADFSLKDIKPGISFEKNIELQDYIVAKKDTVVKLLSASQEKIPEKIIANVNKETSVHQKSEIKKPTASVDTIPAKYYNKAIFRKGIIYMVLIAEAEKPLPYGYFDNIEQKFLTLSISYFKDVDGTYKYCISFFFYLEDAQKIQNLLIKSGFSATIVALKDGKNIPLPATYK